MSDEIATLTVNSNLELELNGFMHKGMTFRVYLNPICAQQLAEALMQYSGVKDGEYRKRGSTVFGARVLELPDIVGARKEAVRDAVHALTNARLNRHRR